eukprot:EG_transcript_6012
MPTNMEVDPSGAALGPLEHAAAAGHLLSLRGLVEAGQRWPATGRTPLHTAVRHRQWAAAALLHALRCDPWQADESGQTPVELKAKLTIQPALHDSPLGSDVPRLRDALAAGQLVPPPWWPGGPPAPSVLDCARAVVRWCGGQCPAPATAAVGATLAAHSVVPSRHVVVVLLDGLGLQTADHWLAPDSCLRRNRKLVLRSNFPSSTTPVLTTLATCQPPSEHAALGWLTYLPEQDLRVYLLPNTMADGTPIPFPLTNLLPCPSAWPSIPRLQCTFSQYANTPYSQYMMPNAQHVACHSLPETLAALTTHLLAAKGETFSYVYSSEPDLQSHAHGWQSAEAGERVAEADAFLEKLEAFRTAQGWGPADLCCLVLADHGHTTPDFCDLHLLTPALYPDLWPLIRAVSGEMRYLFFHIVPGQHEAFTRTFRRHFGATFVLLTAEEVERLQLLGPTPLSAASRARLGNFMALPLGNGMMHTGPMPRGQHGALLPQEMLVPLAIL